MSKRILTVGGLLMMSAALWLSADRSTTGEPPRREVRFLYRLILPDAPPTARRVLAWIPMPFTDTHQTLNGFDVRGTAAYTVEEEPEYGNRFLVFDLSSLLLPSGSEDSISIEIDYRVSRRGYRVLSAAGAESVKMASGGRNSDIHVNSGTGTSLSGGRMGNFLRASALIPIDGRIAAEARSVAGEFDNPLRQARALYDHVVESVLYDKSGEGWGKGDAVYACDFRKGNCTDFHSLFIGESRSLGIPARFVMGVPLPAGRKTGAIPGYHCWAEFFVDPYGWVPIDASEAQKDRSRQEELFGGLDANRIGFTVGRDIQLPGAAAGPLNYVIYPHVEIDGQVYSNVRAEFEFSDAN
ncbi:transglutaminase domain-containing protein [bacterium]|nr:transglutaminase domain-containing protein [bacterium]